MPCEYSRDSKAELWVLHSGPIFLQAVYCDDCNEPLGIFRFTLPTPQVCVPCAEKADRKAKRKTKRK